MKAKSMKLRTLITLHALWKHTDEDHRLNSTKLNKYLEPYNLECTGRTLSDTVRIMQEYGFNVQTRGIWDNQGIWLADRPLQNDALDKLIFAVQSNPYITQEQQEEIMASLIPLVTEFQESKLKSSVIRSDKLRAYRNAYSYYSIIQYAIENKRRIRYNVSYVKYDKETNMPKLLQDWSTLFTPFSLYQNKEKLYMFGYNHPDKKLEAVPLDNISDIKLAFKHKNGSVENIQELDQLLKTADPRDYIPEERPDVIYSGPVVFYCRGQYVEDIYRRFGEPKGSLKKDVRCRTIYPVEAAEFTPETLYWLATVPHNDVRVIGPDEAVEAVRTYYGNVSRNITDTWLAPDRKHAEERLLKNS